VRPPGSGSRAADRVRVRLPLWLRTGACAVLLAGPTALAFFTGGYFQSTRAWAGLVAWLLAAAGAAISPARWPRSRSCLLALGGLAGLSAWTLASIVWAPVAGSAYGAAQIDLLYLGGLLAAALLLRDRRARSAVEPAAAAGALIVVGYGLSERLLPGVLHFARSVSAQGRLEQPLTYWNAMGELAAIGLVVCVRIAGDRRRERWLRSAAAAATAPLGLGLYVSFSRGALFAAAAGVVALLVLSRRREQLRSALLGIDATVLIAVACSRLHGITNLSGSLATREHQGAIALLALALIAGVAALVQWWLADGARGGSLRLPRHAGWLAALVICAGFAVAVALGAKEHSGVPLSAGAKRLVTFESNRYDYWRVALRAFAHDPLTGVGAGGWAVWWLRYRPYADAAKDAHSLELQTLAELGLVGLALLLAFLGGLALAARAAHRIDAAAAAGPVAACVVWAAHSPLDWDWQMPAVTLVAVLLAGATLALAGGGGGVRLSAPVPAGEPARGPAEPQS
jgi:O-Antigen ligase